MGQNFLQAKTGIVNETVTNPAKKFLSRGHFAEKTFPRPIKFFRKMDGAAAEAAAPSRKREGKL